LPGRLRLNVTRVWLTLSTQAKSAYRRPPARFSCFVNLMGTILPLASPFGSFGLPGLRFLWVTTSELHYQSMVGMAHHAMKPILSLKAVIMWQAGRFCYKLLPTFLKQHRHQRLARRFGSPVTPIR
jgi:hypothetical protein